MKETLGQQIIKKQQELRELKEKKNNIDRAAREKLKKTVKFTLRLTPELQRKVTLNAKKEKVTVAAYLRNIIKKV